MAVQVSDEALKDCKTYFTWLTELALGTRNGSGVNSKAYSELYSELYSEDSIELLSYLFERDFIVMDWMKDDENRAADAMELRRHYANDVGKLANKSKRNIDRIWKSIKGKASVLEILLVICIHIDHLVNEDNEPWFMVPKFFNILIKNLKLDKFDDEEFDTIPDTVTKYWDKRLTIFMNREYENNGFGGGLFPILGSENQKNESLWKQMNNWLVKNLDEDGYFREDF